MTHIENHLNLMGMRVRDRVTGFSGVVTCVSFDLYGCVQAIVHPGSDKEGKMLEQCWFDVSRLAITNIDPVMERPNFEHGPQAEGKKGAAEKPIFMKR